MFVNGTKMVPSLPLLSFEMSVSTKENPERKKIKLLWNVCNLVYGTMELYNKPTIPVP